MRKLNQGAGMPEIHIFKSTAGKRFQVGDTVEVFCDHEKNGQRIRGWVKGIVVQVDYKMIAVQFRTNVYLTDGWMVPDHILWFPHGSPHMRAVPKKETKQPADFKKKEKG